MSDFLPSTKFINVARTVTGTVYVEDSDQVLNCDTTSGAVTVNLKKIPANYWSTFYKLYVKDYGNNASVNNITIVAPTGYKINGAQSVVISVSDGCCLVTINTNTDYLADFSFGVVGSNAIVVQNTAYVMKNGSDTTGLVERFDKPFLTIGAAIAALNTAFPTRTIISRVQVIVEDGTYVENINLQKYIDLYLGNSVIDGYISDNNVDFGAVNDGIWHNIIYGEAQLKRNTIGGNFGQSVILTKGNNNVLINCDLISCSINDAVAMLGGYCKIICNNIQGLSTELPSHNAINMAVFSDQRCILEVVGSNIETYLGGLSPTIDFAGVFPQTLKLINCYIKTRINNLGSSSAITSGRTSTSNNGILYLYNTTIYSENGNSIEVLNSFGICDLTVYSIHSNIANTVTIANGTSTLTILINTITINAALPY